MPDSILLLQGPVGPFFKRFSLDLESFGHIVHKINFNGGDQVFFSGEYSYSYTGTIEDWPNYLSAKITELGVNKIYLFGDCRQYHRIARKLAPSLGVDVNVFEEGYLRPNYITLEQNGVNGNSDIKRLPETYRKIERDGNIESQILGSSSVYTSFYAIVYYLSAKLLSVRYPHYQHHRLLEPIPEGLKWLRSGWRRLIYKITESKLHKKILSSSFPDFYLCILQVHSDMQVQEHSGYGDIEEFITEVMRSFSDDAPITTQLVIKHHPMDRGYRNYSQLIKRMSKELNIAARVRYVHDLNLPALLRSARAVVTINSTVGLSALFHDTPVKTMGHAIYDIPGLTSQLPLSKFWTSEEKVDSDLYLQFRAWLLRNNQAKGSFYKHFGNKQSATGLVWPSSLQNSTFSGIEQEGCNTSSKPTSVVKHPAIGSA